MIAPFVKELYNSPNGDRWTLNRNESGRLFVSHHPNAASGGRISEIEVEAFLAASCGPGPEHQALLEVLAGINRANAGLAAQGLSEDATDKLFRALGQAVARYWSSLPQDIQQSLFEAAVTSEGEAIRQPLAVYLHGKHERTAQTMQSRAIPEPDSLGG